LAFQRESYFTPKLLPKWAGDVASPRADQQLGPELVARVMLDCPSLLSILVLLITSSYLPQVANA